jgi:hypothetical protein
MAHKTTMQELANDLAEAYKLQYRASKLTSLDERKALYTKAANIKQSASLTAESVGYKWVTICSLAKDEYLRSGEWDYAIEYKPNR